MMMDLHTHTVYCDGKNMAEEMVLAAIARGITTLGFSGHGYTPFDDSYCMSEADERRYFEEINALKEKYRGVIHILCGIEQDYYAGKPLFPFDFVIGSVHYFRFGDTYIDVDHTAEMQIEAADTYCGGDFYTLAEQYFDAVSHVVENCGADIVGHFDLISKFCEKRNYFDPNHPRYIAAWQRAGETLLKTDAVFELNTGAITRGYRTTPYPTEPLLSWLLDRGARFVINSDSHRTDSLGYEYEKWKQLFSELRHPEALITDWR